MLSFAQICTNLASALEIEWPATFKSFLSTFDVTNADFVSTSSVECVRSVDYYRSEHSHVRYVNVCAYSYVRLL